VKFERIKQLTYREGQELFITQCQIFQIGLQE